MARAPRTTRASAAVAPRRTAATASCPATWTAASSTPAASLPTAWRSAWSAAASASRHEAPTGGRHVTLMEDGGGIKNHLEVAVKTLDKDAGIEGRFVYLRGAI